MINRLFGNNRNIHMKLLIHIILKSILLTTIGVVAYLIFINFIA